MVIVLSEKKGGAYKQNEVQNCSSDKLDISFCIHISGKRCCIHYSQSRRPESLHR